MTLFALADPRFADLDHRTAADALGVVVGRRAREIYAAYDATRAGDDDRAPRALFTAVATDALFRMPAIRIAEARVARGEPTWMYLFTWPSPAFGGLLGSTHAIEIPFVWNTLDRPGTDLFCGRGHEAQALADTMHRAWIAFARAGDPAHPGLPQWPAYDTGRRATMTFDRECVLVCDPMGAERALWSEVELPARSG
jgi:para-nitrobenzyl esterase